MTAFAANMGYGNLGSASNTFTRMKAKYSLQVERVTLSGAVRIPSAYTCILSRKPIRVMTDIEIGVGR